MSPTRRYAVVTLFALAMGYLEAAVVFYLRTMVNRLDPYQTDPLPNFAHLAVPELAREFATMLMLLTVGFLAGRTWRGRLGFALLTFGIWDIAYYIFLIPLTHWPTSFTDWDILFLIPLPWWGPVWSPISIAVLMIAFGLLATLLEQAEPPLWPSRASHILCILRIGLALYIFMPDAISALPRGELASRQILPTQ